jgi:hypothetical protein
MLLHSLLEQVVSVAAVAETAFLFCGQIPG